MGRKALGRGLGALLGEETVIVPREELIEIDLDLIDPNSEQPRKNFEEEGLEELAQSIRANGIVQPIVVRKTDGRYQIVAGERRWRAAQRAELDRIPAVVRDVRDDKLLELALIENIQRQELNPIEEARAYRNLIKAHGLTQESVAERVGKSRTVITTFLRLLKLPKDIQQLVEDGRLTAGHARALLLTADKDLQRRLARRIIDRSLSVRETERAVKIADKKSQTVENKKVKRSKDANIRAAETKLRRYLGTQVEIAIDDQTKEGTIEIEFYAETDLDRIYKLILGKK